MSLSLMGPATGLTAGKLVGANADASDVLKGKKFFAGDKNIKTGTLELTGSAGAGDVLKGVTFYNTNAKSKQTGTLALSGNAGTGDVLKGATFYNTNAKSKQTGTLALSGNAGAGDVISGKTFYSTNAKSKVTGTLALSGNANAAQVLSGYTFYKTDPKTKVTGTMTNRGAVSATIAPGGSYTIPPGYHNGSGKVTANNAGSVLKTYDVTLGGNGNDCRPWTYTMGSWGKLVGVASIGTPAANTGGDINYISISGNTISIMTSGNGYYNRTITLLYY